MSFNLQYYIDILQKRQEEEALQAAANSVQLQFEQDLEAFRRRAISRESLILARLKRERLLEDELIKTSSQGVYQITFKFLSGHYQIIISS